MELFVEWPVMGGKARQLVGALDRVGVPALVAKPELALTSVCQWADRRPSGRSPGSHVSASGMNGSSTAAQYAALVPTVASANGQPLHGILIGLPQRSGRPPESMMRCTSVRYGQRADHRCLGGKNARLDESLAARPGRPGEGSVWRAACSAKRSSGVLLVLMAATAMTACDINREAACPDRPTEVIEERPVETAYRGPTLDVDALMAQSTSRLVVQVTNSEPSVERVRLALAGVDALDVDLAGGASCWGGHNAVFSIAYDPPPGPLEAELDLQGSTSTTTISVPATGTAWAVIDVQSKRAWGDITVYDSRPEWG